MVTHMINLPFTFPSQLVKSTDLTFFFSFFPNQRLEIRTMTPISIFIFHSYIDFVSLESKPFPVKRRP